MVLCHKLIEALPLLLQVLLLQRMVLKSTQAELLNSLNQHHSRQASKRLTGHEMQLLQSQDLQLDHEDPIVLALPVVLPPDLLLRTVYPPGQHQGWRDKSVVIDSVQTSMLLCRAIAALLAQRLVKESTSEVPHLASRACRRCLQVGQVQDLQALYPR